MTILITYETLFDILRKESSREDLQTLPATFLSDVTSFLAEKKAAANGSDAASQRASIEYENIKKILRELYERRERKILLMSLNKARTESAIIDQGSFLEQEKNLFQTLVDTLQEKKNDFFAGMNLESNGFVRTAPITPKSVPPPIKPEATGEVIISEPEPDTTGVKVKFLKAVPKFIGRDMTIFGPFSVDETTKLPEDVVTVLEKKGHVERINTSS